MAGQFDNEAKENYIPPSFLYKYYRIEKDKDDKWSNEQWIKEVILENKVYFPSPMTFNDPFDCRLNLLFSGTEEEWITYLHRAIKNSDFNLNRIQRINKVKAFMGQPNYRKKAEENIKERVKKIGVFCLSEKNDDLLMWSHYTSGHTGLCLEFDRQKSIFREALKVTYQKDYPKFLLIKEQLEKIIETFIFNKSDYWKYEKEWRIIDHKRGSGFFAYTEDALTSIFLGCQIAEKDKQKIIDWNKRRKKPTKVYLAQIKDKEYGLKFELISNS
jgi:hypothetical protein